MSTGGGRGPGYGEVSMESRRVGVSVTVPGKSGRGPLGRSGGTNRGVG